MYVCALCVCVCVVCGVCKRKTDRQTGRLQERTEVARVRDKSAGDLPQILAFEDPICAAAVRCGVWVWRGCGCAEGRQDPWSSIEEQRRRGAPVIMPSSLSSESVREKRLQLAVLHRFSSLTIN